MIYKIKKFEEAFKAGKAMGVAQKLSSIIAKRLKDKPSFSNVPMLYMGDEGTFEGYMFYLLGNAIFIRINFLKGTSDTIFSYDIYYEGLVKPTLTMPVLGLNIVEIVDNMTERLVEDGMVLETTLDESINHNFFERGRPTKDPKDYIYMLEKWVDEDSKILDILQRKSISSTFSKEWMSWVKDKPRYKEEIKYGMFVKVAKFFLLERGLTNKTFRKSKKGKKDRVAEDPILEAQFDDIIDSITADEKFDLLKGALGQMVAGNLKSIFLYGDPGSGKSYETLQTLDATNAEYKVYKGGFSDTNALIRVLYNNRENTILIFDDADSVCKNKDQNNILKAALDGTGERIITYVDTKRASNKGMDDVPQQFEFNSSIIFISNETKIDSAVKSRAFPIEITLSNTDMVERMEAKLKAYRPEVDMAIKKQALEYAREVSQGVTTLDFRSLDLIIVCLNIGGNWKRNALMMLKS